MSKAQTHNSQEQNRAEALERLEQLVLDATKVQKKRKATRPSVALKLNVWTVRKSVVILNRDVAKWITKLLTQTRIVR